MPIASTQEIIEELRAGRMVILVDDEDRENEGDMMIAADFVTPEAINFMAKHARGLVCLTLTQAHCDRLGLTPMAADNTSQYNTAFTVSIEAATGVTTGISAFDRAHTIRVATAPNAKPQDIVQPGHIFPVTAKPGGVLQRAGHTEAGCDLAALAGLTPATAICEVMNEDGTMARLPQLIELAEKHHMKIGTIADLINWRSQHESIVERLEENTITTPAGPFHAIAYKDRPSQTTHIALVKGNISPEQETIVRVQQSVSIIDFLSVGSDTNHSWTLTEAMHAIAQTERGILVLLNCSEPPVDFLDRFKAIGNRPERSNPVAQTLRSYGIGAQILSDIGAGKLKLLGNPKKMPSMAGFGLDIMGYIEKPQ